MTDPADSNGPDATPTDLREWIRGQADTFGVNVGDLLIQSKRRDAMWKGTDADHAKAEWFARLWEQAATGCEEKRIHVRGVQLLHYRVGRLPTD